MIRLTNKKYNNLPEVRKKRKEELTKQKKRKELMDRIRNAKEYELVCHEINIETKRYVV